MLSNRNNGLEIVGNDSFQWQYFTELEKNIMR